MKSIAHKVTIEPYGTLLYVCFDSDAFKRVTGHTFNHDKYGGMTHQNNDYMAVYMPKSNGGINVCTCAHEAYHVADFIADRVGLHVQENTGNEHIAYLVGFVVQKIFDCLDIDNEMEEKRNAIKERQVKESDQR